MPEIMPFKGIRFDPDRAGTPSNDASALVAPPLNRMSEADRAARREGHENNVLRLLPSGEADAASPLEDWLKSGILKEDEEPGLYACFQTSSSPDGGKTRKGLIAMVRAEALSAGGIRPLETAGFEDEWQTCRSGIQFGQPLLLYEDPERIVSGILDGVASRPPDLRAVDGEGVIHRLWRISDSEVLERIVAALREREAIIAGGLRGWETAVESGGEEGPGQVLATLVDMEDEGMTLCPTHRVVHGLPGFDPARLRIGAERLFDIRDYPFGGVEEEEEARREWEEDLRIEGMGQTVFGVAVAGASAYQLYLPREAEDRKFSDVALLHTKILEGLLGIEGDRLERGESLKFAEGVDEALSLLKEGDGQAAFLVNPATLGEIRDAVGKGERFPPRSTGFHPGMPAGLVLARVE